LHKSYISHLNDFIQAVSSNYRSSYILSRFGGSRTIRTLDCSYRGLFVPSLDDSYHVEKGNIVYTV